MSGSALVLPTRQTHPELWDDSAVPERHEPQPPNPKPMTGGAGGGGGELTRNAHGYVERNGIWWPLQGTAEADPLGGGYGFGDKTDAGRTFHPGADGNAGGACNADLGAPCVAPCAGVVAAVLPWDGSRAGEGNHAWFYLDDPKVVVPAWMHWDHLDTFRCREGERFAAGQILGTCGNSGRWPCAHLHLELAKERPGSWWQWPFGWSLAQMEAAYYRPYWWFTESAAKAGGEEGDVRDSTTAAERQAVKSYFEMYGVACNMNTALMQRACLAYYREETPGPALTGEYPYEAHVRQDFTCRTLEFHADDGLVYTVELNLHK